MKQIWIRYDINAIPKMCKMLWLTQICVALYRIEQYRLNLVNWIRSGLGRFDFGSTSVHFNNATKDISGAKFAMYISRINSISVA